MQRKSIITTAAVVAGLGIGVVAGPALRSTTASAQTVPPTQTQSATAAGLWTLFEGKLATALHIQQPALDSAIKSAGSSTADAAVQQGTLTQQQADALKAQVQAGNLGGLFGGRGGPGGFRMGVDRQVLLDAAAKTMNITTTELQTQLQNGQTIAQLAQAHGTTEQAVTNAVLAAAKAQLDQAVKAGTLTQAQADSSYAQLQQRGAQILVGGRGGPGGAEGGATSQAMLAAAAKTMNITTTELQTQLRSGQTIAQLAQAHGTTEQAVTSAALAAAKAQLDQAVKAGTLTQAQADSSYAQLQQRGAQLLTHGGHGRGGPDTDAPSTPATPSTPSAAPATGGA